MKKENAENYVYLHADNYLSYDFLKYIMVLVFWGLTLFTDIFIFSVKYIYWIGPLAVLNLLYLGLIVVLRLGFLKNTFRLRFMINGLVHLLVSVFFLSIAYSVLIMTGYYTHTIIFVGRILYIGVISIYLLIAILWRRPYSISASNQINVIDRKSQLGVVVFVLAIVLATMFITKKDDNLIIIYAVFCVFFLAALITAYGVINFVKYYYCVKYNIRCDTWGNEKSVLLFQVTLLPKDDPVKLIFAVFKKLVKLSAVCVCILLCVIKLLFAIWDAAYAIQERKYYSDRSNFVSVTATCINFGAYSHNQDEYYINVRDMDYERSEDCRFVSVSFDIGKANAAVLKAAGIEEKLTEGTVFTFISAPEYFGDGYDCPVVGIEINGEVLLDFETGYKNLMATYGQ